MNPEPANTLMKFKDFNPINKGTIDSMDNIGKIKTRDTLRVSDEIEELKDIEELDLDLDLDDDDDNNDDNDNKLKINSGPSNLKKHTSHPYGFWDAPYTHMGNFLESFQSFNEGKAVMKIGINLRTFLNKLKLEFLYDKDIVNIVDNIKNVNQIDRKKLNKPFYDLRLDVLNEDSIIMNNQRIKIGRFVKLLFPNIEDKQIEKFVNIFKSFHNKLYGNLTVKIINGEKIKDYYKNECVKGFGPLSGSCMVNKPGHWFDFYVKNKNIKLIVLLKKNQLLARALLFLTSTHYVMERIYSNEYQYIDYLRSWALNNNILVKKSNLSNERLFIDKKNNEYNTKNMYINLENAKFKQYPYLDTFKLLDVDNKKLMTTESTIDKSSNLLLLSSDEGGFINLSGVTREINN